MGRRITDGTNVDAPTTDYPSGRIRNKSGGTSGTIVNESILGDIVQFFAKLGRDAQPAVTFDGSPDNQSNGFQYFQAFINYVRNVLLATESAKGTIEIATLDETIDGDGTNLAVVANKFADTKTIARGLLTVSQSGGNYSIIDANDIYHFTSPTPPDITMPNPTNYKNRVVILFHNNASPVNMSINNTLTGESQINDFYPGEGGIQPNTNNGVFGSQMTFISDGIRWLCIATKEEQVACPFIYINGEYFDEILKNQVGFNNYREEIIDIELKEGENVIRLSEEKKETTFIDYLILTVDGVETVLFDERRVMKLGDFYEFTVNVNKHEVATLKAKGYYIKD